MTQDKRSNVRFNTGRVCFFKFDDYYFPLVDISEGGFLAEVGKDLICAGETVDIEIKINDRYGYVTFKIESDILRVGDKYIAGKWDLNLSEHADTVQEYFKNRYKKVA